MRMVFRLLVTGLFGLTLSAASRAAEFHLLSPIHDLSPDGTVVVGADIGPSGYMEPFRWTPAAGHQFFGHPFTPPSDEGGPNCIASAVSLHGDVIVGRCNVGWWQIINWRVFENTGFKLVGGTYVELPWPSGYDQVELHDTARDGSVSVGQSYEAGWQPGVYSVDAVRWVSDRPAFLGKLPGDGYSSALACSDDASVIVGKSWEKGKCPRPFLWRNGDRQPLEGWVAYPCAMGELDVSGDGTTAVGELITGSGSTPTRWNTVDRQPTALPLLPNHARGGASAVNRDGALIGGWSGPSTDSEQPVAVLWRQSTGWQPERVDSILRSARLGDRIAGISLTIVTHMSEDGRVLAGFGWRANGQKANWYADLHDPPSSDRCPNARDIREQPIITPLLGQRRVSLGTVFDADEDGADTCGGPGKPSSWFVFRAPVDGHLYADLCGTTLLNAALSVHTGCPGGSANEVSCGAGCADAACGGPCLDTPSVPITANQDYYIRVAGEMGSGDGSFRLTTQFYPENDTCEQAYYVPVNSTIEGFTTQATPDGAPACFGFTSTAPGVWYKVIGTGSTITATTCSDADYDTKISVYCSGCVSPLCIDANDDYCGVRSQVSWCSAPGQVYLVLVHGYGDQVGTFELDVTADSTLCGLTLNCAPQNNSCNGAIPIFRNGSNLATTLLIDNVGASTDATSVSCPGIEKDLWFSYTPMCNGQLWVDTCQLGVGSASDTIVGVYDECGGNEIGCNDDYSDATINCDRRSNVIVPTYANQRAAIRVGTYPGTGAGSIPLRVTEVPGAITFLGGNETLFSGASYIVEKTVYGGCPPFVFIASNIPPGMTYATLADDFVLTGTPTVAGDYTIHVNVCNRDPVNPECASGDLHVQVLPSNDACAAATPVIEGSMAFGNVGASTDGPQEPTACNFAGNWDVGSDVWYRYTSSCSGLATVDLCNSQYDSKVAAYAGPFCPNTASAIACNDDACGSSGYQSKMDFPVSEGASYLIRVGGFLGETGEGEMTITCFNDCNANGVNDLIDNDTAEHADCNRNGIPETCDLPLDYDGDGLLSISDYIPFYWCISPVCPGPPCTPPIYPDDCCARFDADADGDVDLEDWTVYQRDFSAN